MGDRDSNISLEPLGIHWKGSPKEWHLLPKSLLHICTIQGKVVDASGLILYTLRPIGGLGGGTFGTVDSFRCITDSGEKVVAIKRPNYPEVHLLIEALFQWRVQTQMEKYKLGFCIPEVYDIFTFKQTGDIWFSMKSYEAPLLSTWSLANLGKGNIFGYLMLQIALCLEVLQNTLFIDHRDLKVNNILVVDTPVDIPIMWKGKSIDLHFPFHIVFVDFGYACAKGLIDVRANDGLPPMDMCPKEGRDIFQILVSLWRIKDLRKILQIRWGSWIRSRIETAEPHSYINLVERGEDLNWMYSVTDDNRFRAPLCTPGSIINDCMAILSL